MKQFPCEFEFSGVYTRIGSYSTIPPTILEQILSIRKVAFIDRKKWDIESYQGSDYESDEYDDTDAIYIYSHKRDRVTGCVRLRPSSKPTLISGALSFMLATDKTRPNTKHCWEATRFALAANDNTIGELNNSNIDFRTAAIFLSMIKFAVKQNVQAYEVVVDAMMEKILKRSGWTVNRRNIALGSKGEKVIYGTLACTSSIYEELLKKNAPSRTSIYDEVLTESLMAC
ncbi:acyl-homoserine-lactone synthase [Pseudomonas frederiksbergensis]|uniref:Acyl-homoserine-lactone synthase n=1 Tax=Pseudomonas frederiksbergensis TaxID=104087 RepID=A0A423KFT4_9PSED|nr:acyl-homoserine-lactone synthase [Pseudomonas frederiksbergensis]RON51647.1 hypothetical protein BK665_17370 [Pseudomonas frederiksbergensis]